MTTIDGYDYGVNRRHDALRGALQDSAYLVTPKARLRLLKVLNGEDSPEANAAQLILKDGGLQQGTHESTGSTLGEWADAVDILSNYLGEPGDNYDRQLR